MNTPHIILVGLCSESNLGDVAPMDARCRILQESLAETRPGWEVVRYEMWGEGTIKNSLAAGLWRRLIRLVLLGWRKEDSYAMALEELFMRKVGPATKAISLSRRNGQAPTQCLKIKRTEKGYASKMTAH